MREPGELIERREVARIEHRELIHQVEVAGLEAVDVVVVAEGLVLVAQLPEARAAHAMDERPVVEHRDVEAFAVPGDELRHLALDRVEEARDRRFLVALGLADREDLDAFVVARDAGDHDHAVQVRRQEVVARRGAALLERDLGDFRVRQFGRQVVEPPDAGAVGNRLDVEGENRRHVSRGRHQS